MHISRRTLLTTTGALALAAPSRAAEKTRVTLWHAMSAALGEELNKLIAAFNASQDTIEVTGLFKGAYKDLMTSVVAAWRAGQAPHIAQVFEVGTQTMLSSGPVIKPVWQLAQETGVNDRRRCVHPGGARLLQHAGRQAGVDAVQFIHRDCLVQPGRAGNGRRRSAHAAEDLAGGRDAPCTPCGRRTRHRSA